MTVIPAIDIIGGRVVRLVQGDYDRCTTYADDPVEVAREFEQAGFGRLHVVDLDGARSSGVVNMAALECICSRTSLSVDFGGGVKSDDDLRRIFDAGADFACVGSMAATDPRTTLRWLDNHGADRIIISADTDRGIVKTHGWRKEGGMTLDQLIALYDGRMRRLMCTDISRDGMLGGAAVEIYADLVARYPALEVIASGGVGSIDDVRRLAATGVSGVVVGKAIYEGRVTLNELARCLPKE